MGAAPMALGTMMDSNPALPGWADRLAGGPPGLNGIWTTQAAEKVSAWTESFPQWLKPHSFQGSYVRPQGRTLQIDEFFRSP
jgi:hypothetical protein